MADHPVTVDQNGLESAGQLRWQDSIYGLGVALCFATSAIFVRRGLDLMDSPLLGLTLGMLVAVAAYSLLASRQPQSVPLRSIPRFFIALQLLAGVFIGLGTWARYIAMDLTEVSVVIALGRVNVPLVLLLSPLIIGRQYERVTLKVWFGAALIIAGALLLIFRA